MLTICQMQGFCQDIKEILSYGMQAPSSHNAQMWKVDTTHNSIFITLDSTRLLSSVDPINREAWISLGAFAENCILSAYDLGYASDFRVSDKGIKLCFFQSDTLSEHDYIKLISERKTVRKPFKKQILKMEHQAEIERLDLDAVTYCSADSKQGKAILNSICLSNIAQFNDSAKLHELSEWTISSKREEKERNDGLSPSDLGLGGFMKFFYYAIFNKEKLQSKSFVKTAQKRTIKQAENCSGYILITSERNDYTCWINSGRLLQKVWLKLTELGISVHPMSQAIEENFYSDLKNDLNMQDKEIQMILRIGYSKGRNDKSKRRSIYEILRKDE